MLLQQPGHGHVGWGAHEGGDSAEVGGIGRAEKQGDREPWGASRSILATTERAIGNIINVVAVFEIHMLRAAVASIKPPSNRRGRPPAATKMRSANRRCRFHRSKASAMRNPPMKRNTNLDP